MISAFEPSFQFAFIEQVFRIFVPLTNTEIEKNKKFGSFDMSKDMLGPTSLSSHL